MKYLPLFAFAAIAAVCSILISTPAAAGGKKATAITNIPTKLSRGDRSYGYRKDFRPPVRSFRASPRRGSYYYSPLRHRYSRYPLYGGKFMPPRYFSYGYWR